MDSVVADHADRIKGLLDARVETLGDEGADVAVQILALAAEVNAEPLNGEPKQGSRAAW